MLNSTIVTSLLWVGALSTALMAGIYFAFSSFVMDSLKKIDETSGICAMQSINKTILNSSFMPLFFGSSIVAAALALISIFKLEGIVAYLTTASGILYVMGMFICTAAFNVPLNNILAKTDASSHHAHQVWKHYLHTWTRWNHLRTLTSIFSCGLFIYALILKATPTL